MVKLKVDGIDVYIFVPSNTEGMVTLPEQVIPQSAFSNEDWEGALDSVVPQWGTPHPTHGYLAAGAEQNLHPAHWTCLDFHSLSCQHGHLHSPQHLGV